MRQLRLASTPSSPLPQASREQASCASLVQIGELLAVERKLVPSRDGVRARVLRRARASVPRSLYAQHAAVSPGRSRRLAVGKIAAAAVMLSALCSAAFYAGYWVKSSREPVPAPSPPIQGVRNVRSSPAAPAIVVPSDSIEPSCRPAASSTASEAAPRAPLPAEAKSNARAKSESDAYAMELRVLQPAQQAVARQDYADALAAVADHRRQFPSGRLAEEREALRVKALLGLGRVAEAQRAGVEFQGRFPYSALHGRMDEMLGTRGE